MGVCAPTLMCESALRNVDGQEHREPDEVEDDRRRAHGHARAGVLARAVHDRAEPGPSTFRRALSHIGADSGGTDPHRTLDFLDQISAPLYLRVGTRQLIPSESSAAIL